MGLFDFLKKKKKQDTALDSFMAQQMKRMFPNGLQELKDQVSELKLRLPSQYSENDIQGQLLYMTSLLYTARDRSSYRVVEVGAMNRPDNKFSYEENMIIYTFAASKQIERMMPALKDLDPQTRAKYLKEGLAAMGNNPDGCTTDMMQNGYGEFGLCATNPVPVRGTAANEVYLESLKHISGKQIRWKRIGSLGAPNIAHPIDHYLVTDEQGNELAIIYISPYQNTISRKAPKGFYI